MFCNLIGAAKALGSAPAGQLNRYAANVYMKTQLLMGTLLLLVGGGVSASGQQCWEYGPTVSLTGTLRSQVFPGPPNYESIKRGDRQETAIILTLAARACTTRNDPQGFDAPETGIREMQLVVKEDAHWKTVRRLMGKRAIVMGTLFHAHTGHHRTKVLVDVANIFAPPHNRALQGFAQKELHPIRTGSGSDRPKTQPSSPANDFHSESSAGRYRSRF